MCVKENCQDIIKVKYFSDSWISATFMLVLIWNQHNEVLANSYKKLLLKVTSATKLFFAIK